jgi:uncharacterized membrane protein YkvA (DUF1232 family)
VATLRLGHAAGTDANLKEWLRRWAEIERDVHALYLAARDPRVPWHAKAVAIAVAAYALSPIDLIPDFIPVLGYLDDLVIVPCGVVLAIRLIPDELMAEFRAAAVSANGERVLGRYGAAIIVLLWILGIVLATMWVVESAEGWRVGQLQLPEAVVDPALDVDREAAMAGNLHRRMG